MKTRTFKLQWLKETTGTAVYGRMMEDAESPPIIRTVYVEKWFLGSPAPRVLVFTIEDPAEPSETTDG